LDLVQYENFLLLLGALFVPLFGVLAAHYYVLQRGHYQVGELYQSEGAYWYSAGVNWPLIVAWAFGFLVYNWINPGSVSWWSQSMGTLFQDWLQLPPASSWLGASVASFVSAGVATIVLGRQFSRGSETK
jgi:cytosine/uracil/thiamine/allantoin permease